MEKVSVEIKVSYACSNICSFCLFSDRRKLPPIAATRAIEFIRNVSRNYKLDEIVLSGGEPSEYPELMRIIDATGNLCDGRFYMHTSGNESFFIII